MDRIESRRGAEALDRQAWLKAYRAARRGKQAPAGLLATAQACLTARAWAAAKELEHVSFRPRPPGLRTPPIVGWLGMPEVAW